MAVCLRKDSLVGVRNRLVQVKRGHERDPFPYTRRKVLLRDLVEPLASATDFILVAPAFADPRKDQTTRVVQGLSADATGSAAIVPGHADGDVMRRELAGSIGDGHGLDSLRWIDLGCRYQY